MLARSKLGFSSMWNENFQDLKQAGFRKGRGARDQIANICWIIEKAREFQKNIYFCYIDYTKTFMWTTNSGQFLKRWEYQTTLPASWEASIQVKKQQNRTWKSRLIQKGERSMSKLYIVTLLIYLNAEHMMQNARLDEAQAVVKIAR